MIAKIKTENIIYDAFVFAVEYVGLKSRVIVFDEFYNELICVYYWNNCGKNVIFTDYDSINYSINTEHFKSYWDDKKIFDTIINKKYSWKMLEEAKEIQKSIKIENWIKLKRTNEFEALMNSSLGFHDSYIVDIITLDNGIEILFDTTWGAYIKLRCTKVIKHNLTLYDSFNDCEYEILQDRVKFKFDSFNTNSDVILEAEEIEFRVYHQVKFYFTNYELSDNKITFYNNKVIVKDIYLDELSICNGKCGMLNISWDLNLVLFMENYFIVLTNQLYSGKEEMYYPIYEDLICKFKEKNMDLFDLEDYECQGYIPNYGELLFEEEYKEIYNFLYITKFILIPIIFNILFWLILKIVSPEMKWIAFYIMGLGVSLLTFIIYIFVYLKVFNYKSKIQIYEDGIIQTGTHGFWVAYNEIEEVLMENSIKIKTNYINYTLIKSKNNKYIYNLITERIR